MLSPVFAGIFYSIRFIFSIDLHFFQKKTPFFTFSA